MLDKEILHKWQIEYKKGFTKPLILLTLAKEPDYPYPLTKKIMESTKGHIIITGSNIYPILKSMEDEDLIIGKQIDTKRKVYQLTDKGTEFLKLLKKSMGEFFIILQGLFAE
jgi:DNA-binding PadR family transcriptional regulator